MFLEGLTKRFTASDFITSSIKIWQNYACVIVSMFCAYDVFIAKKIIYSDNIIVSHLLSDLLLTDKPDVKYHHYLSLCMFAAVNLSYKKDEYDYYKLMVPFTSTEFSTLPYAIDSLIELHQLSSLYKYRNYLKSAFIFSFFYYRIYSYTQNVMWNNEYSSLIYSNENSFILNSINRILIYSFFMLNLYWGCIIVKLFFRDVMIKARLPFKCEYASIISSEILRWSIMFQTFTSFVLYSFWCSKNENQYYLLFLFGQLYLTYHSYNFHTECKNELIRTKDVNYSEFPMNYLFLLDQSAIHVHSFFAALCVGFYTNNMGYSVISIIHHIIGFSQMLKIMSSNHFMRYNENSLEKDIIQLSVGIPLAFDCLYIAANTPLHNSSAYDMISIEKMAITLILFYLNGKTGVFYNYSHVGFHVLVFLQNILLCSIISKLSIYIPQEHK